MGTMNLRLIGILLKEESLKIPIIYNQICSFERFDERESNQPDQASWKLSVPDETIWGHSYPHTGTALPVVQLQNSIINVIFGD